MIIYIVSVFDRAADAFGRPVFVNSVGQATRSFSDELNRSAPDNVMFNHPEDHDLFLLGTFDDASGKFNGEDEPKQLAIGKHLKIQL